MNRFSKMLRAAIAGFTLTLLCACARTDGTSIGDLRIDRPWIRATAPGAPAAGGFATIRNAGRAPDRLLSAQSDLAGRVEVHEVLRDGGMMRMRHMPQGLAIPAGEKVVLQPGGYHLMLIAPKRRYAEGETVPVRLRFERAGETVVNFAVAPMTATGSGHGQ